MSMIEINSLQNSRVKRIVKIRDNKAYRYSEKLFILEGERLVFSLKNQYKIKELYVTRDMYEKHSNLEKLTQNIYIVSDNVMNKIKDTVATQKIIALVEMKEFDKFNDNEPVLLLDRVRDPGNLGTIIRTMAATGFKNLLLYNTADIYENKTIRSSMGGIFSINFKNIDNLEQLKEFIKNYKVITLDMDGKNIFDFDFKKVKNPLFVIGNEANGVLDEIKKMSNQVLTIPISSNVESLNAGVATAILLYEFYKQKI